MLNCLKCKCFLAIDFAGRRVGDHSEIIKSHLMESHDGLRVRRYSRLDKALLCRRPSLQAGMLVRGPPTFDHLTALPGPYQHCLSYSTKNEQVLDILYDGEPAFMQSDYHGNHVTPAVREILNASPKNMAAQTGRN
jgi:hypothetical protein